MLDRLPQALLRVGLSPAVPLARAVRARAAQDRVAHVRVAQDRVAHIQVAQDRTATGRTVRARPVREAAGREGPTRVRDRRFPLIVQGLVR